jgi:site-specific recombinase XerD
MYQLRLAITDFLTYCAVERQMSPHTQDAYRSDLKDFARWLERDIAVTEVGQETLKGYLADMAGPRKLSVSTVRRRFACLRAFFRRLVSLGEAITLTKQAQM